MPKLLSAQELVQLFTEHIFQLVVIPDNIVSDRGTQFGARFWRNFCSRLEITVLYSLQHIILNLTGKRKEITKPWSSSSGVLFQIGKMISRKFSILQSFPLIMLLAPLQEPPLFFVIMGSIPKSLLSLPPHLPALQKWLSQRAFWALIHKNVLKALRSQKKYADHHRSKEPRFKVGDFVWVSSKNLAL